MSIPVSQMLIPTTAKLKRENIGKQENVALNLTSLGNKCRLLCVTYNTYVMCDI